MVSDAWLMMYGAMIYSVWFTASGMHRGGQVGHVVLTPPMSAPARDRATLHPPPPTLHSTYTRRDTKL